VEFDIKSAIAYFVDRLMDHEPIAKMLAHHQHAHLRFRDVIGRAKLIRIDPIRDIDNLAWRYPTPHGDNLAVRYDHCEIDPKPFLIPIKPMSDIFVWRVESHDQWTSECASPFYQHIN
jgi:hypothetical protein